LLLPSMFSVTADLASVDFFLRNPVTVLVSI